MSPNPLEWSTDQWWDVLKIVIGLLLNGILIPFLRKSIKESKAARVAAQQAVQQTAQQQYVNGQPRSVAIADQMQDVIRSQDLLAGQHSGTDDKVDQLTKTVGQLALELARQRGTGTRRMPTEEVPRWIESERATRPSSAPSSPALPSPSSPSATTTSSTPSSGSSSASPSSPAAPPSGPSLTKSVPLPRSNGN